MSIFTSLFGGSALIEFLDLGLSDLLYSYLKIISIWSIITYFYILFYEKKIM
jgi:hypothetical protein